MVWVKTLFLPTKTTQTSQITIFSQTSCGSLAEAWVSAETAASEVGTWRETKPGYPPYPPPPPPAFWGEKATGPWRAGPQALGARAPSPLETWPTGPWGLDPATLTDFLQAKFLTSCCVAPWGALDGFRRRSCTVP